jgi:hypothetical protein
METHIVNKARLALVLAAALLFGLTTAARADSAQSPSAATAIEAATSIPAPSSPSGSHSAEAPGEAQSAAAATASAAAGALRDEPPLPATQTARAVQEAILQASGQQPQSGDGAAAETLAAESNATSQLAWQVQIAQCTSRCVGTHQSQVAEQRNTTVQVVGGTPQRASGDRTQATNAPSSASSEVRQIKTGCLAHCFGTTTTAGTPTLAGYLPLLEHILRELAAGLARLGPRSAVDTDTVEQISHQSQTGAGEASAQSQGVAQVSDDAQLQGAAEAAGAQVGEIVNQTTQGIWQLQIGCLIFCRETTQYQSAEQYNRTTQTAVPATAGAGNVDVAAANVTTQLIWQAQIGCLYWCYDATQQQVASAHDAYTGMGGDGPPAPGAQTPASPPAPASGPSIGSAAVNSGSPPSGGGPAPDAAGGPDPAADPAPAVRLVYGQPLSGGGRRPRSLAVTRRPAASLGASVLSAPTVAAPKPAAAGAHAVPPPSLSVVGATATGAGGASGSNVAGIAVAAVVALLGLCLVCVALLRTAWRVPAAPREH